MRGFLLFYCWVFFWPTSFATTWLLPVKGNEVGQIEYVYPEVGDTLTDVAVRYDMGINELVKANPKVNSKRRLPSSVKLLIPSRHRLPPGPRRGIVINLGEYRLYFYPPNDNTVMTFPVGIGRKGWDTPLGLTQVIKKERDPVWRPTNKVITYGSKKGVVVPVEFPSGRGNPLGRYALRLGWPTYLIHGSNRQDGIGSRVSAGCIRLFPKDMEELFQWVKPGTSVRIINDFPR